MGVPRKKTTKSRRNKRRKQLGHGQVISVELAKCSNCLTRIKPHCVCWNCGYYKGKKILTKMAA